MKTKEMAWIKITIMVDGDYLEIVETGNRARRLAFIINKELKKKTRKEKNK